MKKTTWILLMLVAAVGMADAQVQIRGVVRDADTAYGLSGATVQIDSTFLGVVTNEDGRFFISARSIPALLIIRHIGYRTRQIRVDSLQPTELAIDLEPVLVEMQELVVSGEDPAVGIMRKVLDRKRSFRSAYESTYAEVYTRFWLFREFDPIQVIESIRSSYWRKGEGSRELVRARRSRPGNIGTFRFAGPEYTPNFYDDEVMLHGRTYATPTHPDALELFRFRLGGQRMMDDLVVWDIYFTPTSPTRLSFIGHVAVVDSAFDIVEIDLRPQPVTDVTPPVEIHDIHFEQRFVRLNSGIVVPLNLNVRGYLTFGRLGASYPPARYEQVSGISNYAINVPVPDSMFSDERTQLEDPLVDRSDYLFVRNPTIVPLTPREVEALSTLNPAMTIARAFRPEGLLSQYTAVQTTEETPGAPAGGWVGMVARNAWLWFNRVDGWHPGLGYRQSIGEWAEVAGRVGYSTMQKKLSAELEWAVPWRLNFVSGALFVEGGARSTPSNQTSTYGRFVPGMMNYLGYDDYFDYYRNEGVRAGVSIGPSDLPMTLSVAFAVEKHSSLSKESRFNGWLFRNVQRENPPIDDGSLASIQVGLDWSGSRVHFKTDLEHASSNFPTSDFDFTTLSGVLSWRFSTFFRQRERPNQMRFTLIGAVSHGELPSQRYAILDGSTAYYALSGTFRTLRDQSLRARNVAALFWEHDFTTGLMESLGLWGLAERGSGLILFGGHGMTSDALPLYSLSGPFHEIGLGLAYPFRLPLRIDVSARLDQKTFTVTLGKATL